MASKFQNRLIGTLILVAAGVIILPSLLDGNKKHYEETFASIPLVPKVGDEQDIEMLPPVTQPLPSSPVLPKESNLPAQERSVQDQALQVPAEPTQRKQGDLTDTAPSAEATLTEKERIKSAPADKPRVTEQQQATKLHQIPADKQERAPAGKGYVIQLGALKNATKVEEIIAQLRLSGYRVYTRPSKPQPGELTRIYVGPNISKEVLEKQLTELKALSGLHGQVRNYQP